MRGHSERSEESRENPECLRSREFFWRSSGDQLHGRAAVEYFSKLLKRGVVAHLGGSARLQDFYEGAQAKLVEG